MAKGHSYFLFPIVCLPYYIKRVRDNEYERIGIVKRKRERRKKFKQKKDKNRKGEVGRY